MLASTPPALSSSSSCSSRQLGEHRSFAAAARLLRRRCSCAHHHAASSIRRDIWGVPSAAVVPSLAAPAAAPPAAARSIRCRAASAAAAAGVGSGADQHQPQQVLELVMADGRTEHVEVVAAASDGAPSACVVLRHGQHWRLSSDAGGDVSTRQHLVPLGVLAPAPDSLVLAKFPELAAVLPAMRERSSSSSSSTAAAAAAGGAGAASQPEEVRSVRAVSSLAQLQAQVDTDVSPWRDGSAPGEPIKSQLQQELFSAGELLALLAGQRGLVLVQLFNGWAPEKGQPLHSPLTLALLERALAAPGVAVLSSVAPGGVGLTGILYAEREPWAAWARHMAGFGAQANAVAGSAYYKLLLGLLLGYKPENVLAYVAASGEPASRELQRQVAADMAQLSSVAPRLPWSPDDVDAVPPAAAAADGGGKKNARAGGGKAKTTSSKGGSGGGGGGGGGFGGGGRAAKKSR